MSETGDSEQDDRVKNIFDSQFVADDEPVDVTMEINGEKVVVGSAYVRPAKDGVVEAFVAFKNDNPDEVKALFSDGISSYSIDEVAPIVKETEAEALFEFDAHEHNPVNHHDGRPPWCDVCGLSVFIFSPPTPSSRHVPENFNFGKPSLLHKEDE